MTRPDMFPSDEFRPFRLQPGAPNLRQRIDACFDERLDPLDDPELCRLLERDPEALAAVVEERAMLRELGRTVPVAGVARAPQRRRRLPLVLAAAAALLLVVEVLRHGSGRTVGVGAAPRGVSRILSASLAEQPWTARPAATFTVREQLVRTETTTIETYELHTLLR